MLTHPAIKYMNEFLQLHKNDDNIDRERVSQVKEIIELICENEYAEECGTCMIECEEVCVPIAFLIRSMLWKCKMSFVDPVPCEHFKDILYSNVIATFA